MSIKTIIAAVDFNVKWRIGVIIATSISFIWNIYNSYNSINVKEYKEYTSMQIDTLKTESRLKDVQISYLIAESIKNKKNTESMPFAIWSKRQINDSTFVYDYYNKAFFEQFLEPLNVPRYHLYNKTDFAVFDFKDASAWLIEDLFTIGYGIPKEYTRPFKNTIGEIENEGYKKWRIIEDGQKFSWGMMNSPFIKPDELIINKEE